jgi:hypothetical protein
MKPPIKKEHKAVYGFVRKEARCVWVPGTEDGPCVRCAHAACVEQRALVASACLICGKAIGYSTPFIVSESGVTHSCCFLGARLDCGAVH